VAKRGAGSDALYFEGFRTALADAPTGLIRPGGPASDADLAAAEARLRRPVPPPYATFLRSFDGADLFHETYLVAGVGREAWRSLVELNAEAPEAARAGELVFAESTTGDLWTLAADGEPAVWHLRAGSDERWLSGSSFPRWLDALVAREQLLYDRDGEFRLEAFDEDGEELSPAFALRQAERALRKDPGSAESHHDLGVGLRRVGKLAQALDAFSRAAALDPLNPWPPFDAGRAALALEQPEAALASFRQSAAATPGPDGARLLAWAARAARDANLASDADATRREALARDPEIVRSLERAAETAAAAGDVDAREEAEKLVEALSPPKRRLPVVREKR
jgi:tetratricopeptide (TPR) repeat protein